MHFGPVDSYNGLKRRSLERTIFVSGGLRSRYPPNHEPKTVQKQAGRIMHIVFAQDQSAHI